ncbi:MAG: hypothetical protein HXY34_05580 [Candidatus Thorarchaeota archaeon]|nr:hypothetical protein [Candidatus Thorarchaeota archaeon]
MQITTLYVMSTLFAVIISFILSGYLLFKWSRQEARLLSDLPFLFGVTFIMQAINMLIQTLVAAAILPDSLEVLRVRALVIAGTAFPMLTALLIIWLPGQKRHHVKILVALLVYWILVALLAPDSTTVQALLIPILVVMMFGLAATFAVTWRTGRLKEVRSELMLVSLSLIIVSQLSRVSLIAMGLVFVADTINVLATLIATVALINPWYHGSVSAPSPTTSMQEG